MILYNLVTLGPTLFLVAVSVGAIIAVLMTARRPHGLLSQVASLGTRLSQLFASIGRPLRRTPDEPEVGTQLTDMDGDIWERGPLGWNMWSTRDRRWFVSISDTQWDFVARFAPFHATTNFERDAARLPYGEHNDVMALCDRRWCEREHPFSAPDELEVSRWQSAHAALRADILKYQEVVASTPGEHALATWLLARDDERTE